MILENVLSRGSNMMPQEMGLTPDINVLEAMDIFKNLPDEEIPKYRRDPQLALFAAAEMDRRLKVRQDFQARQFKNRGAVVDQLQQELLQSTMPSAPRMMPPTMSASPQNPETAAQPGLPALFASGGSAELDPAYNYQMMDPNMMGNIPSQGIYPDPQKNAISVAAPKPAKPPEKPVNPQTIAQLLASLQRPQKPSLTLPNLAIPKLEMYEPLDPAVLNRNIDQELEVRKARFPDNVPSQMEELINALAQTRSPEEIKRRSSVQAGIRGLGYQGRDFGGGLATMFEGYEATKDKLEEQNKEAKLNATKARLSLEQYKSAVRRNDFESARRHALEVEQFREKSINARNQLKLLEFNLKVSAQKGAGALAGKPPTMGELLRANQAVLEMAQPELKALDNEFDKRSKQWFGGLPKNWKDIPQHAQEYESRRNAIIEKYKRDMGLPSASAPQQLTQKQQELLKQLGQ